MTTGVRIYQSGLKKLQHILTRFPKEARQATAFGMYDAAQRIMALASARAPIGPTPDPKGRDGHPGALRAGAYADSPTLTAHGVTVDMGFAGLPEPYMVRQHEEHRSHAKFFSSAVDDLRSETQRTIASYVNAYIKTGVIPQVPKQLVSTKAEVPR
jgi:hypothetical protein